MLGALIRNVLRSPAATVERPRDDKPLRLHIGGEQRHPDWKIVNVTASEATDYVRSCTDLTLFASESVTEIYASHVLEHLGYKRDLPRALREFHRVLVPGGRLSISVPDLQVLCGLFLDPALEPQERFMVMRMMFGGQMNAADFHYVGLSEEFLSDFLQKAGFVEATRVSAFGLFEDTSNLEMRGRPISLNMTARKPA